MAEASPIQRPSREPRGGRRRPPAEHAGDRCSMCRRKVTVDAQGRCPLGHQVVAPEVVEDRAAARGEARERTMDQAAHDSEAEPRDPSARVVATYVEPGRGPQGPAGGWQGAAWSASGPAVEPARATRMIDLTSQTDDPTGHGSQPDSAQAVQAGPGLPRRHSTAPPTPPHGMNVILPVMPAGDDAPEATAELIQVPVTEADPPPGPEVAQGPRPGAADAVEGPADAHGAASPRVFEDPPPPLPLRDAQGHEVSDDAATSVPTLPQRTRTPMVPQARSLFTQDLGAEEDDVTPPEVALVDDVAALGGIVRPAPEPRAPADSAVAAEPSRADHAAVPLSDLTPTAPSVLDLEDTPWTVGAASPAATYEQEPMVDPELEPPRGIAQIMAGVLFVAVLVAIAWYLATNL
ncbi:MAG TPA: hypothetical protein VMM13_21175 [Euzebya sp.]|nr:hypothetical protein [Euzebya sp.]